MKGLIKLLSGNAKAMLGLTIIIAIFILVQSLPRLLPSMHRTNERVTRMNTQHSSSKPRKITLTAGLLTNLADSKPYPAHVQRSRPRHWEQPAWGVMYGRRLSTAHVHH